MRTLLAVRWSRLGVSRPCAILAVLAFVFGYNIAPCAAQSSPPVSGATAGAQQVEDEFRSAAQRLRPALIAVVALGNQGPLPVGTGFFVDQRGTFLTAAHVLDPQPGILSFRAYVPSSEQKNFYRFDVVSVKQDKDIAVCRMRWDTQSAPTPRYEYLRVVAGDVPPPGSLVAVAGFPLGDRRPIFQFGTIASFAESGAQLQIGLMLNDGDSGGPVIEVRSGTLIGMVVSVRTTDLYEQRHPALGQQNTGLSWVLPTREIAKILELAQENEH